jgi:hypothetical protein
MDAGSELEIKVKGFNQSMISEMFRCYKEHMPFSFFGNRYTVMFYEVSRDMNDKIKSIHLILKEIP